MDNDEYQRTQDAIVSVYQMLSMYNIEIADFLTTANRSLAIGMFFDPTAWIQGNKKLQTVVDMAETLRPAIELLSKLRAENGGAET